MVNRLANLTINYFDQLVGAAFTGIATFFAGIGVARAEQLLQPKAQVVWWSPRDVVFELPLREATQGANHELTTMHAPTKNLPRQLSEGTGIQPEKFEVRTRSIFIQNVGKSAAQGIEIAHKRKPQHFKLYPSLNYRETITPDGVHVVVIDSLAAKEVITFECLSVNSIPEFYYVRAAESNCKMISFTYQQIFPRWFNLLIHFLVLVGAGCLIVVAVVVILSSFGIIKFG